MISRDQNPFPHDSDRHEIWDLLMRRDFEAFLSADWSLTEPDFLPEPFQGIDCRKNANPAQWCLRYPSLKSYRDEWLRQAADFKKLQLKTISKRDFLFQSATLVDVKIEEGRALAQKKFDGSAETLDGAPLCLLWQTVYFLQRNAGRWKITGFVGYLPYT